MGTKDLGMGKGWERDGKGKCDSCRVQLFL